MSRAFSQLLKKYNIPGPRYTSYPTVPAWHEGVTVEDYRKSLRSLKTGEVLSLYFHLPFCEKLCHFCGCMQVITGEKSRSRPYVDRVLKEIDLVRKEIPSEVRQVNQIHFGGGTPNFLQPEELTDLMAGIRRHFDVLPDAEIAIEMHPRTSTRAFCENLIPLRFNRISLGVQDFDPKVQALINRHQSHEMTRDMVRDLRDLGFDSFNFDLIYGLPGQSLENWKDTLAKVVALRPNRLAVYSYAHVPWIRPVQRTFQDSDLPSPELKLELFEAAYETFLAQGYRSIGMDHFALAEDELSLALDRGGIHRNFMGYSTHADSHQIGFGVSAISYVGGHYFQNQKELPRYEAEIDAGELAVFRGFLLNDDDARRRDLITRLMCRSVVEKAEFARVWNIDFEDYFSEDLKKLAPLETDGLVQVTPERIQATESGKLFVRILAMAFDAHLEKIRQAAKTPTFSKTV